MHADGNGDILRAVVETGILLSAERDLERLLQKVVENARDVFRARGASIFVLDGEYLILSAFSNPILREKIHEDGVERFYRAKPIQTGPGSIAGYTAFSGEVLIIDDPYHLPPGLPYSFDPSFDRSSGHRTENIVSLPLVSPHGGTVGVLQLISASDLPRVKERQIEVLKAFSAQAAVAVENAHLIRRLEETRFEMITRLAAAAEFRDKETGEHLKRMSDYCAAVARKIGWDEDAVKLIRHASPMHDIGKIAVPDAILLKPGPLTDDEWVIMKQHTTCGADILAGGKDELTQMSFNIALCHHERFDGKGYPKGLSGEDIPPEGRIVSLADVYDALTSKRPYKEPFPHEKAVGILKEGAGSGQFDPEITEMFFAVLDDMRARDAEVCPEGLNESG